MKCPGCDGYSVYLGDLSGGSWKCVECDRVFRVVRDEVVE